MAAARCAREGQTRRLPVRCHPFPCRCNRAPRSSNGRLRSITTCRLRPGGVAASSSRMRRKKASRLAGGQPIGLISTGPRQRQIFSWSNRRPRRVWQFGLMDYQNCGLRMAGGVLAAVLLAHAEIAAAPSDPKLVIELERTYSAWKSAMTGRDLEGWARHTARARQMAVRNTIVSQKREWPRALFSLAMLPPEVEGLRLAGSETVGGQARLIYNGRVDFRLDDPRTPPDAALVLDFVRESGGWKFYGGRYHGFENDPDLARKVASGDLSDLSGPARALTGDAPPVPAACPIAGLRRADSCFGPWVFGDRAVRRAPSRHDCRAREQRHHHRRAEARRESAQCHGSAARTARRRRKPVSKSACTRSPRTSKLPPSASSTFSRTIRSANATTSP